MKLFRNKYRYIFILLLASYSYLNTAYLETFHYYGIQESVLNLWMTFILIVLLVWEGNRFLETKIEKSKGGWKKNIHPLLPFFIMSIFLSSAAGWLSYYFMSSLITGQEKDILAIEAKLSTVFALRVNLFLHCLNGMIFFINQSKQKEIEAETLRRTTTQARLQAIRSQINPHFLFNNLNVLSTLIMTKNEEANKFIESFSAVYRHILQSQEKELVPLQQEIEFIRPYIFLLETRFGNGLNIQMDIPESYLQTLIVPVALQMLIENAIKHNIVSVHSPLFIKLNIDDKNYLRIRNNIQLKKIKEISTQTGLANINDRYQLTTDKIILINHDEDFFEVAIPLIKAASV